ncbi:hypothetical protein ColLi_13102 [Colletotrichum liriopes]|uniref:Uncharacterized protein n=1 Tax=Colletotrichum liriopes TaxID=708192 RepID=A0AA37LZE0_9PEZI|nr:hypothetical protein ColLi_13102 [Colletotrichum liriopes]
MTQNSFERIISERQRVADLQQRLNASAAQLLQKLEQEISQLDQLRCGVGSALRVFSVLAESSDREVRRLQEAAAYASEIGDMNLAPAPGHSVPGRDRLRSWLERA